MADDGYPCESINFLTDDEIIRLHDIAAQLTTGPWQAGADLDEWLVAQLGASSDDDSNWFLTTRGVNASRLRGDAKTDAEGLAYLRNILPRLLNELIVRRRDQERLGTG